MIHIIVFTLYLLIVPFLVMLASKRWRVVEKINPMVILYVIGLVVGNVGIVGQEGVDVCTKFSNVTVLLAIPLMLLSCDFRKWSAKASLKAFFVGLTSVLVVTVAGFFMFRGQALAAGLDSTEFAKVSAGMTGIYTGGIPNFAPVSKAVGLPQHLFLIISGYDIIVTATYLLVIVFLGKRIVKLFFPGEKEGAVAYETEERDAAETFSFSFRGALNRAAGIAVAAVIVAVSVLLSKVIPVDNSTAVIIILITTVSIACSFIKPVKRLEGTFDTGLYFVYVFCLAVATMVNLHEMDFSKYLFILFYIAFAVYGSLALQIVGAKIFKISGALTLTASISLINSPPFVPMVAAALNNRDIILPGIAIGLLGYAAGNYLGIGMFYLLGYL